MFNFGILGINARNLHYIGKYNPAKAVRLADDKIVTKTFLTARGIPVPTTYAVIKDRTQLAEYTFSDIPHESFIIKPARGSRGRGIFRVTKYTERPEGVFSFEPGLTLVHKLIGAVQKMLRGQKPNATMMLGEEHETARFHVQGKPTSEFLLKTYCLDILDGKESLQGKPDRILIEELLTPGAGFEKFCSHGLADIRIIVYNFVPVAAMVRVPTAQSGGKANLDRGGVGCGVEVGSGKVQSMYVNKQVYKENFPEPYTDFLGTQLPYREDILEWSSQIQYYVNLGYLALDRVITDTGPKLLEINARAGLKIQLALDMPLRERLEKISSLKVISPEKGVEICQALFTRQKTGLISPNKVLPLQGYATLSTHQKMQIHDVTVHIDMYKQGIWFDSTLAKRYQFAKESFVVAYLNSQVTFTFSDFKVDTSLAQHHIIIGGDMLSGYVIKPVLTMPKRNIFSSHVCLPNEYDSLRLLDTKLAKISSKLVLSQYLKPTNFLQELDQFVSEDGAYNPQFLYQRPKEKKLIQVKDELCRLREEFTESVTIESPLLVLFTEKITELSIKADMLSAYRKQDFVALGKLQEQYWGSYDEELLKKAISYVSLPATDKETLGPVLSRSSLQKHIKSYLNRLGWHHIEVRFTPETFARMSVQKNGGQLVLSISSGAHFRKYELFATLAHELVHLERYSNGAMTDRSILKRGTAKYFIDEEGLAIRASEQELPDAYEKRSMRKKYVLIHDAQKHNFEQLAAQLLAHEERTLMGVFKSVYRLKRGVMDTALIAPEIVSYQDMIYAQGYERITNWLSAGNDIVLLKKGKIKIEDLCYLG